MPIRLRLAAVFAIAAAALFALGGVLFASALSSSLLRSIDAQLAARVDTASRYLPGRGIAPPAVGAPDPGEYVVQVIDASGRVRAASADAGRAPMLSASQVSTARRRRITVTAASEGERERLTAEPLASRPRPGWVSVAGVSLEAFDATMSDVTRELVIAGVITVVIAGLGAYAMARAALSPVERMRREVASLSERDQSPGVRIPRTRDELAALAVTMNDLLARLQRALDRQRALVADASHELRTPFAVLRGELELASRPGRSPEELAEAIAHASEETARLARITEQLLFLARSDEDRMTPRRRTTEARQLLRASAEQAAGRAQEAGVMCDLDAPDSLTAFVDPDLIREAMDNLVDNALGFAPMGTTIHLTAWSRDDGLILQVSDDGPGFPPDFLPHAFERFRRPDAGRARVDGGAGLGLAIANAIARAHGGRAIARNKPGGGAVVALEIPAAVPSGTAGGQAAC